MHVKIHTHTYTTQSICPHVHMSAHTHNNNKNHTLSRERNQHRAKSWEIFLGGCVMFARECLVSETWWGTQAGLEVKCQREDASVGPWVCDPGKSIPWNQMGPALWQGTQHVQPDYSLYMWFTALSLSSLICKMRVLRVYSIGADGEAASLTWTPQLLRQNLWQKLASSLSIHPPHPAPHTGYMLLKGSSHLFSFQGASCLLFTFWKQIRLLLQFSDVHSTLCHNLPSV